MIVLRSNVSKHTNLQNLCTSRLWLRLIELISKSKFVARMTRLTRWRDHADLIADHICSVSNKAAPPLHEILQITDGRRSHGLHSEI